MAEAETVTDAKGRKFDLLVLNPEDVLDLYDAAETSASNPAWVRYAMVICSVSAIDDVPVPRPGNKRQIKALAARIGNDGVVALMSKLFGATDEDGEKPSAPPSDSETP
jgi:hypothetical protein